MARVPTLLTLVLLALPVWVGLVQADDPGLLLSGVPLLLVLVLYLQAGRGGPR